MEYLSERITNISDLEKLLENINIKAQVARKSTCISDIQALASDIASLSEKAAGFEFRIEKRKVKSLKRKNKSPENDRHRSRDFWLKTL
ncbi:hypothetical protein [Huintestinicola sp.]